MMGYYDGLVGYGFGGFFMIIFWVFIVLIIIRMVKGGNGGCCGHNHGEDYSGHNGQASEAGKILEQRYAKGEITKEQFEEMKKTINNK